MLTPAPHLDEPIEVVCAAIYHAELIPAYAFVFRVPATWTRFTIYAATPDAYTINHTYQLTITEPPAAPAQPAPADRDPRGDGQAETAPNLPAAQVRGGGTDEAPEYVTLTVVLARHDGQRWRWSDVRDNDPPMWLEAGVPQFWAAEPGIADAATTLGAEVEEPFPGAAEPGDDR